tara:strand:+ start:608 stop:1051 length:444 start_codon:yes stop_codon:yes gene_type:complete
MASRRSYAYYIKGNKLAIIEKGLGSGLCSISGYSNQTTCEAAGGTWTENAVSKDDGEWMSPILAVTDGIQLQYAHTPSAPGDEGDDIGLMRYQSIAVVYFVKAKLAEDMGDIEKREFFMREFRRQLEKGSSALKGGPHIVQGLKEMR